MKLPDLIHIIEDEGWRRVRMRGPHRQYVHPNRAGVLTVRRSSGDEIGPGATVSMLTEAGVIP